MKAELLMPGNIIGICSPSSIADKDKYSIIKAGICKLGYRVKEAKNLYKNTNGYSATPEERAADFMQLIRDPEVKQILFGGGEGGNELLPLLDYEEIKRNPKQMCSYSDGTTLLNAVWANTGLETYYGMTPRALMEANEYDIMQFNKHLSEGNVKKHIPSSPWTKIHGGIGEGVIIGGYSRCFAMLLGNRYFPIDLKQDYILIMEDHEVFGGIDRLSAMISHVEQHDIIKRIRGLVFGHYSVKKNADLMARLKRFGEKYQVPVAYCDDFGHGQNHAILPIGRKARMDGNKGELEYL